jgi:plasmid stabilization system protein ParE
MIYDIRLTERADQEIIEYTCRQWGVDQAQAYMAQLGVTIEKLRGQPQRQGRSLDELKPGLRYVRHEQHYFIFYRVRGARVEVLRIIHQRRDWRRLMNEPS